MLHKQDYSINEFFDRYTELKDLKKRFDSCSKGELFLIYGRRRLGKTKLVLKFLDYVNKSNHQNLYCYTPESNDQGVMRQFSYAIKESFKDEINIKDWNIFFDYIEEKAKKGKFILVIDEFQRLQDSSKDFFSIFQHYWDNRLKNLKIMVVALGSSIGMMKNIFLTSKGALYGRVTGQRRLKPFKFIDFREMFKELSFESQVQFYSVFGGTPHYLDLVKKINTNDIFETILRLCLYNSGPLIDEPERALTSELKTPGRYNELLTLISSGKKEFKELEGIFLGKKKERGAISPYLNILQNLLDIVEKEAPLLIKVKSRRYEITDNFFRFWYKFIFPNKRLIELNNYSAIISKIKSNIESYYGRIFENIIKELLILYNGDLLKNKKIEFEDMGSWWHKDNEIDVILKNRNQIYLGDIKWKDKKITLNYVKDFIEKKDIINFNGVIKFMFFSRPGFEKEAESFMRINKILYMDLKDIQEAFDFKSTEEKKDQRTILDFFD